MSASSFFKNFFKDDASPVLLTFILVLLTAALYSQVITFDFIDYDDSTYVTENFHIHAGFSPESVKWAFTTFHAGFWQPLIWLSFMLDIELYGLNPAGFHATNLFLHMVNVLLLFLFLRRATDNTWKSWIVALLFALHPLHIESVAWIAERKDVLSTFFLMLLLISYHRYVTVRSLPRYLLVFLFFVMGLSAKAMLVSVPLILLLLDYWPFNRLEIKAETGGNRENMWAAFGQLSLEKLPFVLVTILFCGLTLFTQKTGGALVSQEIHPLNMRLANALVSYISYIGKMFLPVKLAVLYPFPESISFLKAITALAVIVAITVIAIRLFAKMPYLFTGWLWYMIAIFPVIGLVQVGPQAMADRFTYIPLIGIYIACVWACADLAAFWQIRRAVIVLSACAIFIFYTVISWNQLSRWQNTLTLFSHTLKVTENNYVAHAGLGMFLSKQGKLADAAHHLKRSLEIAPGYKSAHNGYGITLAKMQRLPEAGYHFSRALEIDPHFTSAHFNLGFALYRRAQLEEAARHFAFVIESEPLHPMAHFYLGNILAEHGDMTGAISHYRQALKIVPDDRRIRENLLKAQTTRRMRD